MSKLQISLNTQDNTIFNNENGLYEPFDNIIYAKNIFKIEELENVLYSKAEILNINQNSAKLFSDQDNEILENNQLEHGMCDLKFILSDKEMNELCIYELPTSAQSHFENLFDKRQDFLETILKNRNYTINDFSEWDTPYKVYQNCKNFISAISLDNDDDLIDELLKRHFLDLSDVARNDLLNLSDFQHNLLKNCFDIKKVLYELRNDENYLTITSEKYLYIFEK